MTLSTYIIGKDPIAIEPLFRFCQGLLSPDIESQVVKRTRPGDERHWRRNPVVMNVIGQGLPSMLIIEYGADGPLVLDDPEEETFPEDRDYLREQNKHRAGAFSINLDTAYGYRGPNGGGCSDLHAWLVQRIGRYLEERGVAFEWRREFTGEWYSSLDDLHELGDPDKGLLPHTQPVEAT